MTFHHLLCLERRLPETARSIQFAADLASRLGACLTVGTESTAIGWYLPEDRVAAGARETLGSFRDAWRRAVDAIVDPAVGQTVLVRVFDADARPERGGDRESASWDLIVHTLAEPTAFWGGLQASERRMVRDARVPVLLRTPGSTAAFDRIAIVVGPDLQAEPGQYLLNVARAVSRLIAPVDGPLQAGQTSRRRPDAGFDLLCPLPLPGAHLVASTMRGIGPERAGEFVRRVSRGRQREVEAWLGGQAGALVRVHVLPGAPRQEVIRASRRFEVDLVVVPLLDGGVRGDLLAHRLHCPLLLVPPFQPSALTRSGN